MHYFNTKENHIDIEKKVNLSNQSPNWFQICSFLNLSNYYIKAYKHVIRLQLLFLIFVVQTGYFLFRQEYTQTEVYLYK